MDDEIKKENSKNPPILWLIFRKEAEEMRLSARIIEGIRLRIKEKLREK